MPGWRFLVVTGVGLRPLTGWHLTREAGVDDPIAALAPPPDLELRTLAPTRPLDTVAPVPRPGRPPPPTSRSLAVVAQNFLFAAVGPSNARAHHRLTRVGLLALGAPEEHVHGDRFLASSLATKKKGERGEVLPLGAPGPGPRGCEPCAPVNTFASRRGCPSDPLMTYLLAWHCGVAYK